MLAQAAVVSVCPLFQTVRLAAFSHPEVTAMQDAAHYEHSTVQYSTLYCTVLHCAVQCCDVVFCSFLLCPVQVFDARTIIRCCTEADGV